MLATPHVLVQHKSYGNARLLWAIGQKQEAARGRQLRELLHHTLLTNRLWLRLSAAAPYSFEPDSQAPEARAVLIAQYQETHAEETNWRAQLEEGELDKTLETPYISGRGFSVADGLDAGVPAQPRAPRPLRQPPAPVGRNAAWSGLHSMVERSSGRRVALTVRRAAALARDSNFGNLYK